MTHFLFETFYLFLFWVQMKNINWYKNKSFLQLLSRFGFWINFFYVSIDMMRIRRCPVIWALSQLPIIKLFIDNWVIITLLINNIGFRLTSRQRVRRQKSLMWNKLNKYQTEWLNSINILSKKLFPLFLFVIKSFTFHILFLEHLYMISDALISHDIFY